ncbi:fibronectin-like isoform X2 [Branchiostoma floridae x Branchiostoma japonicum]
MGFKMSSLYLTLVFVMWACAATATATTTVVVSTAAVSTDSTASTTTITTDSTASTAAVSTDSTASTAALTTDSTASAVAVTTDSTASTATVTTGSTATSPVTTATGTATSPVTTATVVTTTRAQTTAAPHPIFPTTLPEVEMPSGLRLVFRETDRLGVEWTGSADSYRVTYQVSGDIEVDSVASVPNTTHTIGNLTAGTSYAVRVYSIEGGRESAPLEGHWGTRPEAPTSLQLMTVNTDSLRATWNASSSADFYRVTYQASGGPEIQSVASVAGATHTIRSLSPGTLYTVRVYGIKNLVEGEPLLGDMRTEPEPPTNLQFTTVGIFRSSLLRISWTASSSADTYRVSLEATGGPEVTFSVLADTEYTATGLSSGTLYTARVYSRKNDTEGALPLEGQQRTKPKAPTNLQFITVNARSIEVSWNVSSSADTYRVTYLASGGTETLSVNSTHNTTHTIESLLPGTLYMVLVYGIKGGSESVSINGDQGTRPESPTNLQFITVDSDSLEVTWNASSSAETYRVTYQTPGGSQNVDIDSTSNTTHTIEGLQEVTSYAVRVYGIANGVESVPLLGMERTLPEAPTNLQFVTVTTDSLEVTWNGSAEDYTVTAEGAGNVSSVSTSNTTHTFGGLSPGTLYTVRVTGMKNGSLSNPIDGLQGTKPEAPTYRDLFARTTDSLGVEWNASSSADAYRVTYQVSGGAETDSDASTPNTMHTIGGLSAGNLYTVRVYGIKHGAESEPLQLVLRTNPEAPTDLQFITGTDSLQVSWTASSSADTYRVTYVNQTSGVAEVVSINSTSNTTHAIEGLLPGTVYTIRVYGFKNGLESLALRGDQGTRPESPTNLQLVEEGLDGIRVSWNASGSVDNYNVTYQTPGGVESADVVSWDRTTHLVAGLPSGTLYTVRVYGIINDVASLPIQGDQRTIVGWPRYITIPWWDVTENSINVTWSPADGAKDSYNISISPPDGDNPTGSVADGDPLDFTFTGLTAGTLYTISVTTISGVKGRTARRNQRTDTAPARNVSITEATENNINITWAAAAGAKDNYSISIFPSDGDNPTGTVDEEDPLVYNFTGLTPGTLYTISVRAVSGLVYSVARTEIGRTKPNSPGDITTDIVSASIATWEPSTGGVFSGYEIIYTTDDGSPHHTITVNNGTTTAPSPVALTIGTVYTLEMYAFSDDGGYRTESERKIVTVGINTTAPTTLLQTCRPSFQQFSVLEETASNTTFNVMIPDSTSCHNCSIIYKDTTCFIDDVYNVSSYVVANVNSSSTTSCNLFIISPVDRETTSSIRFDVSWTRSVYNHGYNIHKDCGSIPVEIVVVDTNDNPPVFGADLKTTLYIRDQTPVDTILAVASAQDADTGTNADVTYSIPSSKQSEYFEIDSDGVVTTRRELTQNLLSQSGLLLDEEVEVVVMATDGVHNTTTTLSFRFLDTGGVNATVSTLEVLVPEEEAAGTTVINLRDQRPFDDDNIIYRFTHASKSFELNSTSGEVTTAEVLDREQEDVY